MAAVLGVHQTAGKELFITFMTFAHSHLDSTFSTTKTRMKAWDSWQKQRKIEEMLFWKMAGKMNVSYINSNPFPPHLKKKETGNAKKRICNKWTGPGKRRRAKFEIIISNGPTTVAQSLPVGRRTKEAILSYIWINPLSLTLKSCFCSIIRKPANSFQTCWEWEGHPCRLRMNSSE